ncbi:Response regulator receiver domain-containing protein [Lachnospiraceae bacterium NE2001]|nr:Response regulator receiver domain-containing protein [Lachnospiraceae bacterium NE2001]
MDYKVLMIDDDEVIAQSTAEYFNMFDVKTAYVTSFDDALSFIENNSVSLLLLDINLGDRSGFELCKRVRENLDIPILFISARTSDDDVLIALNIGGDDYIKKPYTLNVLLAKVRTILSRYEKARETAEAMAAAMNSGATVNGAGVSNASSCSATAMDDGKIYLSDELLLDTHIHKLRRGDEQIALKAMEYKMLLYLLENRGRVVTKDELLRNVWDDEFVGEGTLAVHIRHLREKVEKDSKNPQIIKTAWGVGYMIDT